jgi:hypothetical protein
MMLMLLGQWFLLVARTIEKVQTKWMLRLEAAIIGLWSSKTCTKCFSSFNNSNRQNEQMVKGINH